MSKKVAIVLFNLGGPDSLQNVKHFLFNLFSDKYIIRLPKVFRYIIAKFISIVRSSKSSEIYSLIGGKSPILHNTQLQLEALELLLLKKVDFNFKLFICMRHWNPNSDDIKEALSFYDPDEVILLPLYPQFSTTTTLSSINDFLSKIDITRRIVKTVCCYPNNDNFIRAHVDLILDALKKYNLETGCYRILFSAHGLPYSLIKSGDPYEWQIIKTVECIVSSLGITDLDYRITYQSKIGPIQWLQPNTEDEIYIACKEKRNLLIVPVSFVSEHVETLVELDLEYKKIAIEHGVRYIRVQTLSVNKYFIECLSAMVLIAYNIKNGGCNGYVSGRLCPANFSKCPNMIKKLS